MVTSPKVTFVIISLAFETNSSHCVAHALFFQWAAYIIILVYLGKKTSGEMTALIIIRYFNVENYNLDLISALIRFQERKFGLLIQFPC